MNLIPSRRCALSTMSAIVSLGLALAGTVAHAGPQRTHWYSIDMMSNGDAPPLFLTVTSSGVTFEGYRSGDPTQQWALTQPDYPTAPAVQGHGPIDGILDCRWGCPFSGHGGDVRKFVNRASGRCLAFIGKGGVSVEPCAAGSRQIWGWVWGVGDLGDGVPPRDDYTALAVKGGGQIKCLAATTGKGKGGGAAAAPCAQPMQWFERFRFLEVADLSCMTDWAWNLCFVEGQ